MIFVPNCPYTSSLPYIAKYNSSSTPMVISKVFKSIPQFCFRSFGILNSLKTLSPNLCRLVTAPMTSISLSPPFTRASALIKVKKAQDLWNGVSISDSSESATGS